jgi:hypothetical protein
MRAFSTVMKQWMFEIKNDLEVGHVGMFMCNIGLPGLQTSFP